MNPRVFVSYSQLDADFAKRLTTELEHRGAAVWLDAKNVRVGDSISTAVERGLAGSDFVCLVLSSHSSQSRWVDREYRAALSQQLSREDQKPTLLPVVVDDVVLPTLLRDIRYADFRRDFRAALEELCHSLRIPVTAAPFMSVFAGYDHNDRDMLPPKFIEFIARQDVEALSTIWNALVDGTKQLESELTASSPADRVLVDCDNVDMFLKSEDRRTGVVRVGPVSLEEIFDAAPAPVVRYGLAMSGVWSLLWYLARHFNECVARRLYFVPSLVAWTRQWEGRDPGVVDFRTFLGSTAAWSGHEA